ncbi:hypothetical protein [Haematobacter genomosp. 1]|uniref:Acyltransferase 3 domain-containing protein n=1 Tax=Haematobacter genomosp. 1 TaxID=366618 RepID=A0A212A7A3_9RHOB|nr:hypothetical protein [Haematobacter genomosp. 1]OWJ75350.1 hypothetical protein CDV49_17460 [Haematobacter genomosp. 1]
MQPAVSRISSIDLFRYLTVSFALFSHTLLFLKSDALSGGDVILGLKSITRTATPALMILFGVMAEIVYLRRYRSDPDRAAQGMISRAIICYICYVALVVLALVFGHVRGGQAIRATLLVAPSPYANIFKIYTFLLPITLLLVQLRARTGLLGPWVVVAGIWLLDWIVLDHLPAPPVFAHFAGFLFGIGTSWGPSILHSLTLVVMGMTLGAAFFSPSRLTEKAEMHAARLWLGMATGLSLLLLGTKLGWFGLHGVLLRIADITQWRGDNDIGYYAYGLLSALGLLFLARSICIIAPQWVVTPLARIGGATLAYFFIGNALLLILPSLDWLPFWGKASFTVAFLVFCGGATLIWDQLRKAFPVLQTPVRVAQQMTGLLLGHRKSRTLSNP